MSDQYIVLPQLCPVCKRTFVVFPQPGQRTRSTCSRKCANHARGAANRIGPRECAATGCDIFGPVVKGYCRLHYERFKTHGTPYAVKYDAEGLPVSESDARWMAGLIDCDGCINITRHGRPPFSYSARVQFTNTDMRLIEEISRIAGVGRVYTRKNRPPRKPIHYLNIHRAEDVDDFLVSVKPFLVIKKEQAELALSMPPKCARAADERIRIFEQCRVLNKRGR